MKRTCCAHETQGCTSQFFFLFFSFFSHVYNGNDPYGLMVRPFGDRDEPQSSQVFSRSDSTAPWHPIEHLKLAEGQLPFLVAMAPERLEQDGMCQLVAVPTSA